MYSWDIQSTYGDSCGIISCIFYISVINLMIDIAAADEDFVEDRQVPVCLGRQFVTILPGLDETAEM